MTKTDLHNRLLLRRSFEVWEDFGYYSSGGMFTSTGSGTPTAAVGAGDAGLLVITGDTSANDYMYVGTTNALFTFKANAPLYVEFFEQFSEQNTNQAAMMFGLSSSVAAGTIVNTTGEPATSFSGAVIYKVPGGTVWKTCSSVSTTQNKNTSTTTAGGTAYSRLGILIEPISSTIAEVTYYVDSGSGNPVPLQVTGGRPGAAPIKDQLTYTGAAGMKLFVGLKQISTSNAEVLNVDYVAAEYLARRFT